LHQHITDLQGHHDNILSEKILEHRD